MNAKNVTIRLLWKEYRLQRAFWVCMAGFAGLLFLFAKVFLSRSPVELVAGLFGIAITIPAFYALGCGATMFSAEHETGTFDFQRTLPVSPRRYFFTGVAFGLLSTIALIALLLLVAVVLYTAPAWISRAPLAELPSRLWPAYFGVGGVGVLELFVWGVFFSLILKRPLVAAILGVAVASIGIQLAISVPIFDASLSPYIVAAPRRLAIVTLVAVADVVLAGRWFRGERVLPSIFRPARRYRPVSRVVSKAAEQPSATADRPRFSRVLARLFWQQAWQSGWVWLWFLAAIGLAFALHGTPFRNSISHNVELQFAVNLSIFATLLGLPLVGVYVFFPDQQRQLYRFFDERGVRPGQFWWARQIAGLTVPLILAILFYLVFIVPELYRDFAQVYQNGSHPFFQNPFLLWLVPLGIVLNVLLIIYAVGQFFAMILRSGILAMLFSVILSLLMIGLMIGMIFWDVPWWWSIAPWPFVFLLATRLRAPAWLAERKGLRDWLRPAIALVPMLAMLAAIPLYRVFSVPEVSLGFSPEQFVADQMPTLAARETSERYRKAWEALVAVNDDESETAAQPASPQKLETEHHFWRAGESLSVRDAAYAKANVKAIELALEASKRTECNFYMYSRDNDSGTSYNTQQVWGLLGLVLLRARQLEADGDLDAAWEHYLGALRIARHLDAHATTTQYCQDTGIRLYARLVGWAAQKGQTPERIRAALKQLEEFRIDPAPMFGTLESRYLYHRALLTGERTTTAPGELPVTGHTRSQDEQQRWGSFETWRRFLPWEKYRALRILNVLTSQELRWLESQVWAGEKGTEHSFVEGYVEREPEYQLKEQVVLPIMIADRRDDYRLLDLYRYERASRNAALVSMALEAWKLEHGSLPKTLDELKGSYFAEVPKDPFTGRDFRYFPEGSPIALTRTSTGECLWIYGESQSYPTRFPEKKPFLWSTGPWIYDVGPPSNETVAGSPLTRYSIPQYRSWGPYVGRGATTEAEIWSNGLIFPLP
jgi:hypothetical protein